MCIKSVKIMQFNGYIFKIYSNIYFVAKLCHLYYFMYWLKRLNYVISLGTPNPNSCISICTLLWFIVQYSANIKEVVIKSFISIT